ncbi:MAG: hypothetical protein LBG15_12520 [Dysgonamonadaceae bacterium]|jgi:hypothetical protein|nr:hypothetical protein [Dysgonamonadaceae bacterium]
MKLFQKRTSTSFTNSFGIDDEGKRVGTVTLVKVKSSLRRDNLPYFLSLWVDDRATMDNINDFLCEMWLECCRHLDSFTNLQNRRNGHGMLNFFMAEELLEQSKQIEEYKKIMEEIVKKECL